MPGAAEQLEDPRVKKIFAAKEPLEFRVASSFFTISGWVPDQPHYVGIFDPDKDWVAKRRGELRVAFEGDPRKTKVRIKDLLDHALSLATPTQAYVNSSEAPSPSGSDSSDVLVADLPRRTAAATARARLDALSSPDSSAVSAESLDYSPPPRRRSSQVSDSSDSSDSSPIGSIASPIPEQPNPAPAPAAASPAAAASPLNSSDEEEESLAEERKNFGATYTRTSADKAQPVRSVTWTLVDETQIREDVRANKPGVHGTEFPPLLLNQKKEIKCIGEMFDHLIPSTWLSKLTTTANESLFDEPLDKNYRKTSVSEMTCVLGLALGAAANGSGPFDSFFARDYDELGMFPKAHFGKFGVPKNRAEILLRAAHLSDGPLQPAGADPHWFIDGPLKEYNEHMASHLKPSWLGCVDESGPPWHGKEGEGDFNKCPHVMWVPRKPEPLCAEFNDSGCAICNVMMWVEYEKAAKYHATAPLMTECKGKYNAALAVRAAKPWAGTNAVVYGDARFGSVNAAVKNMQINGTHSIYDIKTGSALFPQDDLKRLCGKKHGDLVVMKATVEGVILYAIAQRRGPAVHTFLSTCGTFDLEIPSRYKHIISKIDAPWLTPSVLNTVTKAQPMVDKFNRTLFDVLGIHDTFTTRCFETRFAQHFCLPLVYVNAVNASKYFLAIKYRHVRPKAMLLELADYMARNPEWLAALSSAQNGGGSGGGSLQAGPSGTRRGTAYNPQDCPHVSINGGPPSRESPGKHVLIPLSQIPGYKGAKQQRCFECNMLCSWACARCSTSKSWVALHPPVCQGSKRKYGCLAAHRRCPQGGGYKEFHEGVSGTSAASKRRRKINLQHIGEIYGREARD